MKGIFLLLLLMGIGWFVIQVLPVLLPFIGYAFVGVLVISALAAVFDK